MDGIKMQNKIVYTIITAIVVASIGFVFSVTSNENIEAHDVEDHTHYSQSDLGKAFPDHVLLPSSSATDLNMEKAKKDIISTIQGTVVGISGIKTWNDTTMNPDLIPLVGDRIKIDVQIEVEKSNKGDYKKGDIITVTLTGALMHDDKIISMDDNEQFEIGEEVIVHIAKDPNNIIGDNIHYVKLGQYGKYSVQNDKAYNERYHDGIPIAQALNEAN
jgi:hypothetical protein